CDEPPPQRVVRITWRERLARQRPGPRGVRGSPGRVLLLREDVAQAGRCRVAHAADRDGVGPYQPQRAEQPQRVSGAVDRDVSRVLLAQRRGCDGGLNAHHVADDDAGRGRAAQLLLERGANERAVEGVADPGANTSDLRYAEAHSRIARSLVDLLS